jgi:TolA-binding protein
MTEFKFFSKSSTILLAIVLTVAILSINLATVKSQTTSPQSQLNLVIQDVQKAESAGANSEEMQGLVVQLNRIIQLQNQNSTQNQSEINNGLTTIDSEANQIQTTASQRTSINHLTAYATGLIGAMLATIVSHFALQFWRKYQIKRTFQMKIIPK